MVSRGRFFLLGAVFIAVVATVSGQQPIRQRTDKFIPPIAPLLPVEEAWMATLPSPPAAGGALDDLHVYVPLQPEQLVALNRETGVIAWARDIESAWPPVAGHGAVYLAASDEIHALDAQTGGTRWRASVPRGVMARMVVTPTLLLVLLNPDEVWAIEPETGDQVFRTELGGTAGAVGMQADATHVYVSASGARVVAVALETGRVRWTRQLAGTISAPAVGRDRVFVGSTDNHLYALDADSGKIEWRYPAGGDVIGAGVDKDLVYFASLDNMLRGVNRGNGNQRWRQITTTRPLFPPIAFDGVVALTGISPTVASYDGKTGAPVGTWTAPPSTPTTPVELQGEPLVDVPLKPLRAAMFAITRDGRVVATRPVAMMFRQPIPVPLSVLPGVPLSREISPLAR